MLRTKQETHKRFAAFMPIIGGTYQDGINEVLGNRPMLLIAGEKDTQKASAGQSRIVAQKQVHSELTKAGLDSTLIIQAGTGHAWSQSYRSQARDWLYEKLPVFAEFKDDIIQLKDPRIVGRPALMIAYNIAQSPFNLPGKDEAIDRLNSAGLKIGEEPPLKTGGMRTWTSSNGKTLEAEFAGMFGTQCVVLRKTDGKRSEIGMRQLTANDQAFIQELRAYNEGIHIPKPREWRTWTSSSGRTISAKLISWDSNGMVKLKKEDGSMVGISLKSLSATDNEYVESEKSNSR